MKNLYTIGLDFGTKSARALLVNISSGAEIDYIECEYPHGVIEEEFLNGEKLPDNFALQHPDDYFYCLKNTVPNLIKRNNIKADEVVGIGIDFTACTVLPIKNDGTPICKLEKYKNNPHAFVKLWKHHAAQYCADIINEKAKETNQSFLNRNGGKISSEFYYPKLLQLALEAPDVFEEADLFIEAGDYLVYMLTGNLVRSACMAGFKALYSEQEGYPSVEFLNSLKTGFGEKALSLQKGEILPAGSKAGYLTKEFADRLGLTTNTVVCAAIIDAHAALPAAGITTQDEMLMILGTSGCHISLSKNYKEVEGICGIVKDGVIEGYYAYEAGQAGLGDHFEWINRNLITEEIQIKAKENNMKPLEYLGFKASEKKVGSHGLLALDWFNGNRTVLTDSELSGVILGLTLNTKVEDIYAALVDAICFGSRKIIENYEKNGVAVKGLYATGSMAQIPFVIQTFADVINKEIKIAKSSNGCALGSAIFAAAASGVVNLNEAIKIMGKTDEKIYIPNKENNKIYNKLYKEYEIIHDYFGRGANPILKTLKKLKEQ